MTQANSIYICKNCGKEYSTENQTNFKSNKFCCKSCLEEYNRNNPNNQIEIHNCEYCGAEFTRNKNSNAKCCCRKCTSKLNFLKYPELKEKVYNASLLGRTEESKQKIAIKQKEYYEKCKLQKEKELLESRKPYNCENCGKLVEVKDWYSSGRFCCSKCSKSYAGKQSNKNGKVSEGMREYAKKNKLKYKKYKYKENTDLINSILELSKTYNSYDMLLILNENSDIIRKVLKENGIDETKIYIRANNKSTINLCKNVLQKETSITSEDVEKVKEIIHKHIFDDNIPPQDIAVMYNYSGKPETFSAYLTNCLHLKLKTCSESVISYNERIGYYDNLTEREKYYKQCAFTFNPYIYEHLLGYELLGKYGWYIKETKIDGLVRDHRISRIYGWENKINPNLISHPANCELMLQSSNSTKSGKCSITVKELKEQIKKWDMKYGIYNQPIYDENLLKINKK